MVIVREIKDTLLNNQLTKLVFKSYLHLLLPLIPDYFIRKWACQRKNYVCSREACRSYIISGTICFCAAIHAFHSGGTSEFK